MVTSTFDISGGSRLDAARATGADRECLRYRLDVIAVSALDVVQSAGGWLYDRAMAGWQVTVLLPNGSDARSLRILGVQALDLEDQLAAMGPGSASQSLAVSAEAFTADARVRDKVLTSLDDRLTEVALWGRAPSGWPLRGGSRRGPGAVRAQRGGAEIQGPCAGGSRDALPRSLFHRDLALRFGDLWARRLGAGPARLMKKYYRHTLLYLHETISLGSGEATASPRFSPTPTGR